MEFVEPLLREAGTVPKKTGFFGLSLRASVVGIGVMVVALLVAVTAGAVPGGIVAAVGVLAIVPMSVTIRGRSVYEQVEIMWQFWRKKRSGQLTIHTGPSFASPGRALPLVLGRMEMIEWPTDGVGNPFGLLRLPSTGHYTVVLKCWPGGEEARTQDERNLATLEWGRYLAQLSLPGDIVAAQVVVESFPATGQGLAWRVEQHLSPNSPPLAQEVMRESAETFPTGALTQECRLSLTFQAGSKRTREDGEAMAAELANRLPALYQDLMGAGVQALPMTGAQLTQVAHRAFVPEAEADLEFAHLTGEETGLEWTTCGPETTKTEWASYRHAGGVSSVWEMMMAPQSRFTDQVLLPLLAPTPDLPRKRVTITYRPVRAADATKIVDKEYKDALIALQTGKAVKSAAAEVRLQSTEQARDEQVRGAGLVRYSLLLTITEDSAETLPSAEAILQGLSTRSRISIQRAYGFQDMAFQAGLGLGVLLPEHVSTSGMGRR